MNQDWNGILWPSLGYPQGVDVQVDLPGAITVLVFLDVGDGPHADQVAGRINPVAEIVDGPIHLQCLSVEQTSFDQLHHLGLWPSCVTQHSKGLWRLTFEVPSTRLPETRRTVLCDLDVTIGSELYARPGAVYLQKPNPNTTTILLATDIHVARRWEWIEQDVQRVFDSVPAKRRYDALDALATFDPAEAWSRECILHSFVNPNRTFASFIETANRMAQGGLIDCVWLTGDLVDYTYSRPKAESGKGYEHTEWFFLKELMLGKTALTERLCVPTYMLTGNHDHRLYPYHLQTYGLRHCGIADEVTWAYLRRMGAWRRWKYRASDLDAVRISRSEHHALNDYHREFNPTTDYSANFNDLQVVALDTSYDFFCDFSHLKNGRRRRFLKGIQDSLHTPYSNGFSKQQVNYFKEMCGHEQHKPLLVMAHTPTLNPYVKFSDTDGPDVEALLPLRLDATFAGTDDDRSIRFEEETAKAGLDNGTVFQNILPFLQTVQAYPNQVVVLSGHNHEQIELGVDKQNGQFYQADYSRHNDLQATLSSRALLMQTPALGHLKMEPTNTGFPAYRTIVATHRSIASLDVHHLGDGAADFWFYDWEKTDGQTRDIVTLTFRSSREAGAQHPECLHKVVIWPRPRKGSKPRPPQPPFQINVLDADAHAVVSLVDRQLPSQGGYMVLLTRDVPRLALQLDHRPAGSPLAFVFETFTFEKKSGQYVSLGLKWHHRELKV